MDWFWDDLIINQLNGKWLTLGLNLFKIFTFFFFSNKILLCYGFLGKFLFDTILFEFFLLWNDLNLLPLNSVFNLLLLILQVFQKLLWRLLLPWEPFNAFLLGFLNLIIIILVTLWRIGPSKLFWLGWATLFVKSFLGVAVFKLELLDFLLLILDHLLLIQDVSLLVTAMLGIIWGSDEELEGNRVVIIVQVSFSVE